ncbi:MAG TPA: hypothetical protein VNT79_06520 [Phycisphaerae bacterium]|nr:hypothetical protein [Phycisphaerae bacterium]
MTEALRGFQPEQLSNLMWTMLAGWLVWPVLCGLIGMNKGMGGKGAMHGLVWGPIGLIVVLAGRQKHPCPTCGCKTLNQPADRTSLSISDLASEISDVRIDPAPHLSAESERSAGATTAEPLRPPTERRIAVPQNVVEEACAGYSEEEAARLLAWVNEQRSRLGVCGDKPVSAGGKVMPAL